MKKFINIFLILLSVCWLVFIFSNSLKDANESSEQSGAVVEIVKDAIDKTIPENNITLEALSVFIRKGAHFTEFFIFSLLVTLTAMSFTSRKNIIASVTLPICAAGCITDELLQNFSVGRSCSVVDMMIDYCGVLSAFLIIFTVFSLNTKKIRTKL